MQITALKSSSFPSREKTGVERRLYDWLRPDFVMRLEPKSR